MDKKPRKRVIASYIVVVVLWSLVFAFVMPRMNQSSTQEVNYSQFIDKLEKDQVQSVELQPNQILFHDKDNPGVDYLTSRIREDENLLPLLTEKGIDYNQPIQKEMSPLLSFFLTYILPIFIMFGLISLLMRSATKRMGGGNALSFGKSDAKVYVHSKDGKSFEDVAGQDEAKDALMEVVDFLHDPEKYSKIGAVLPKGVLLVGPPGTGKTLLAQAVAGEAQVPFFSMSGSEFVEMFVGMGASKVRDLFKQAIDKAPCIVFIDEVDAIGKRRDTAGFSGNDEREQTLNQLLNEMDGFSGNEGVVILAATNRPEILDPALTRPGRFDRQIPVELPDLLGRQAILQVHARKVIVDPDIDYRQVALMTAGASGAQLANIINESALRAVRQGRTFVTEEDLIESVEVVIAGQQKKGMVISRKEKELIAYHEVGHALVAALQSHSAPVTKITIIPRTSGALGYTMQVDEEERFLMTKEEIFNKIVTTTGGRVAEELVFNTQTTGASNDIEKITQMAKAMVTQYGMTDEFGMVQLGDRRSRYLDSGSDIIASPTKAAEIDDKVEEIIKAAHQKATDILRANLDKLHEISQFLLEKETITGEEFMDILDLPETMEEEVEVDGYDSYVKKRRNKKGEKKLAKDPTSDIIEE